jgi:hypothetical protein
MFHLIRLFKKYIFPTFYLKFSRQLDPNYQSSKLTKYTFVCLGYIKNKNMGLKALIRINTKCKNKDTIEKTKLLPKSLRKFNRNMLESLQT